MIRAEVKYTAEHFKAVTVDMVSAKTKRSWVLLTILATILGAYIAYDRKAYFNLFTLIAIVLWLGIAVYFLMFCVLLSPKKQMARYAENNGEGSISFEFGEDRFTVSHKSKNSDTNNRFSYGAVELVSEKSDFFRIQVKGTGVFAIKTSEFTEGTPDDFRALMMDKLGEKFRQQ